MTKKIKDTVLLFSGGPDSIIGYWWLYSKNEKKHPLGIYIPLGHKYETKEIDACMKFADVWDMRISITGKFSLGDFEEGDANIPGRNMLLCLVAANYGSEICLVVQKGELNIFDRSKAFLYEASRMLGFLFEKPVKVFTPFENMSKVEMVEWFLSDNILFMDRELRIEILKDSTSCYEGGSEGCGVCKACFRRWVAFSLNGIEEGYRVNPWESKVAEEYLEGIRTEKYIGQRADEIIKALLKVGKVEGGNEGETHK